MTAATVCGLAAMAGDAAAQTAVCSDEPSTGERVECTEDTTSSEDIGILLEGVDIDFESTVPNTHAVNAEHAGTGNIDIDVTSSLDDSDQVVRSTIDTSGQFSTHAVHGNHTGTGTVDITVSGTTITTTGTNGQGIHGRHLGAGKIQLGVSDSQIHTTGIGIHARHYATSTEEGADANVSIMARSSEIITEGTSAMGIWGASEGLGDARIFSSSNTITTKGEEAAAIYGYHVGTGDIFITSVQDTIVTEHLDEGGSDSLADGILGWHQYGDGDTYIKTVGGSISTAGIFSFGIAGLHARSGFTPVTTEGVVEIDVEDTVIETTGLDSYGIYGRHTGSGALRVVTKGSQRTTTTGDYAHGIVAYHSGTEDDRSIDVTIGGTVDAQGAGANGVRVGVVSSGNAERAAAFDEDGYRRHTVTVNGAVKSAAEGLYLAGGGKVFIGSAGTIRSGSRIAVLASGDTPGDTPGDPSIKPKLQVDMTLAGRRVADVIGDGWIINDGGETTIVVNDVKLHDGASGVTEGAVAANGAWDVSMVSPGVRVTDRTTDPENWVTEASSTPADRDFSTADFTETRATCPPGQVGTPPNCSTPAPPPAPPAPPSAPPAPPPAPAASPPTCPPGQVGTPPACTLPAPDPGAAQVSGPPPVFQEEYAPRAALYEALPGFLRRLDARPVTDRRTPGPGSPFWARLSGSEGSFEPANANVGAEYDFSRSLLEAGVDLSLREGISAILSLRSVGGTANVSATTGGGNLTADGTGAALDVFLTGPAGGYAASRVSATRFSVGLESDSRGILASDIDASGLAVDLEAGRKLEIEGRMDIVPRAWLAFDEIDVESFTDAVESRVAVEDASRLAGGIGLMARTAGDLALNGGSLALHGSVDLERVLDGPETIVSVSGERLLSEAPGTRLHLGLGGTWRRNGQSVSVGVSAAGIGSDDTGLAGHLMFSARF